MKYGEVKYECATPVLYLLKPRQSSTSSPTFAGGGRGARDRHQAASTFTKEVVEAMVAVQEAKGAGGRPIIFALSNPKTQAEITAADCYKFSNGKAIFGSGTRFFEEVVNGQTREPGQVKDFVILPGMSYC